jgi:hypothetical protein
MAKTDEMAELRAEIARLSALVGAIPAAGASVRKLSASLDPIEPDERLSVVRALGVLKSAKPDDVAAARAGVEKVAPGLLEACRANSERRGKSEGHSWDAAINYLSAKGL